MIAGHGKHRCLERVAFVREQIVVSPSFGFWNAQCVAHKIAGDQQQVRPNGIDDRAKSLRDQAAKAAANGRPRDTPPAASKASALASSPASAPAVKARKLSYKEQRELDELPKRIEVLEAEQKELGDFLARPESYSAEPDRAMKAQTRHAKIDEELLAALRAHLADTL